ncbi:MAG: LemA family protein [Burkholderiaceae bacterium]
MLSVNGLAILVVLLAVVLIWAVVKYNEFIASRNRFHNAFAQIDVQLKRRYDLIPNLVKATRAYLAHERETLEAVVQARQQAVAAHAAAQERPGDASGLAAIEMAEAALAGPLGKLFALVESYPDLKADETVAHLVEELSSTENRIAFARQAFNDDVMRYNTSIESFPASIVAGAFGFRSASSLRATRSSRERESIAVEL